MRTVLIGGELGFHHRVTDLAAELDRVHVLNAAIGGQRHDHDIRHGQREDDHGGAPLARNVEIEARPCDL